MIDLFRVTTSLSVRTVTSPGFTESLDFSDSRNSGYISII